MPNDYYPTPPWVVWRLLDACFHELFPPGEPPCVLEPTIGDGAIVRATHDWLEERHGPPARECIEWTGVELRRDAYYSDGDAPKFLFDGQDFRSWTPPGFCAQTFDLAIGNPPFSVAEGILRHAIPMAKITAMLLRLNFLGSEERVPFWREFPRPAIRVIPERVSFDGTGGTDSDYVAWYIWGSTLRDTDVLDLTPVGIRNAHQPIMMPVVPQLSLELEAAE